MPAWQRTYLAACGFATAFALAYVAVDFAKLPRLFYDGIHRRWWLTDRAGPVPMGYVGLWLWALLAGAVGAGLVIVLARLCKTPLATRSLHMAAGWTLAFTVIAAAYYCWHNWPFAA